MNKTMKKVLSGITGLALAAPMAMNIAFAESDTDTKTDSFTITQACVDARTAADDATIASKNTEHASEIAAIQAHKAALIAAAALTDATAKKDAFKKAETDLRAALKSAMETSRTAMKASMDAVKTACGKPLMGNEGRMMEGRENGKKGFLKRMMNAFGHGKKPKGEMMQSSSPNAQ